MRNATAERLTRCIQYIEQCDRNEAAKDIGEMPSPHGDQWASYIQHRLRVVECGINEYTNRQYAHLRLDKYINWHRAIDMLAGYLVNHKPAIVMFGAGKMSANSPIKIKKQKLRCPFSRKLIAAFEKRQCIVRMVDEFNSSQHCGVCIKRFPRRTKPFRFKKCENCVPKPILLPPTIVTNKSKRELQMERAIMEAWQRMGNDGENEIAALLTSGRLVPKKTIFLKTWYPNNEVDDDAAPLHCTVWHRDISAARLIMYRGE